MAANPVLAIHSKWFRHRANVYNITLDNSYPTGGYALTANQLSLNTSIMELLVHQSFSLSLNKTLIAVWDSTNQKLVCYWSAAAGAVFGEVTAATDLSTYTVKVTAIGR